MTDPLDAIEARRAVLDALIVAWQSRLLARVATKVADAHAHGVKALTEAARNTADGRSTILRLNASPSFQAATYRLDELWTWLAGPSEVSLVGKIRDAREDAFAEAMRQAFPLIPESIRDRAAPQPTRNEIRQIRAASIHGYDPRKVLTGPIETAKRSLKAALEQATRQGTPGKVSADTLAAWELRTKSAIGSTVKGLISDSVWYADREAGQALIHADYVMSV